MTLIAQPSRRSPYSLAPVPLAACLLLLPITAAGAAELGTRDVLKLGFDTTGAVARCTVDGRELLPPGARGGLFVADVQDISAKDQPLLENGGFEQTEAGKPVGWSVGPDWQLERSVAHTGQASMRVSVPEGQKRPSGSLAIELPVRPNTPYRLSLWVRTQGCAPSLYIVQCDAQGKQHPDYPQVTLSHRPSTADWFSMGRSFTTGFFCHKIRVYSNLWNQSGTAWLDDVSLTCLDDDYLSPQQLVGGKVSSQADTLQQVCELPNLALRLRATYQARPDYISVDGEIEDTSLRDRAVTVSFRLPIDAAGWTWFNDLQNQQAIDGKMRYGSARLLDGQDPTQRRTISLYPFSALGDGQTGLALAVPMDMPRVFRLGYDAKLGYVLNYEFGLSQAAKKFPGKASFRFFLYRVDPRWGFRSAAQRYYQSHPQFFTKRAPRDGAIGSMVDCNAADPAHVVAPFFADFNWHRRQLAPGDRRELIKLLHYTEFIGWWGWALGIKPEEARRKPTPEEAWAHVEELAHRDPPHKVALSILNCAPYDRNGKPKLHWDYQPNWGGYNYLCNPDPEIEGLGGKVNRFTLTYEREVSEVDTLKLDGMRYDNPIVFATDNFRREHFQWADHPLAFDHLCKKPVIPLDFSSYECAKAIADDMHRRGKLAGSNYTPVDCPSDVFGIQVLDIVGSETLWTWPTNAKLALQRALAYQKIVSMSWQEAKKDWPAERIEREVKQAMFYGTFYYLSTMSSELYNRWTPLVARLATAGWEPVTHARCGALGPMVERFGSAADASLHFTLRNEAERAVPAELLIDAAALGLKASPESRVWLMRDAQTADPLNAAREGSHWRITLTVPAKDTVVLRVASSRGLALDRLFLVPDRLRVAANYREALRQEKIAPVCPDYDALVEKVSTVQVLLKEGKANRPDVLAQLRPIAAALTVSGQPAAIGEALWWAKRLTHCTDAARRDVSDAIRALEN